ncbi:MAG TPA: tripartite tricarboxylate transporter TctB family protein [Spirochaetia bacterium]|nr:tripartite tricarboxylate transporter TctB family protein [Spirochaetia bacterium]
MTVKQREIASGMGFLALAGIVYAASFSIKKLVVSRIGAAFVPQLAAYLLAGLSIVLIIQGLLLKPAAGADDFRETASRRETRFALWSTIILLTIYGALLEPVGFLITTTLYLFIQFIVLAGNKKKNFVLLGLISVATSVAIYALFVYGFDLMLPAGILG